MSKQHDNQLRDMHQSFTFPSDWDDGVVGLSHAEKPLAKTLRAKVFKSGNSLAIRIPAGTKLQAGMEMELTITDGEVLALRPALPVKRKIDVSKFAGKAPWLKELPRYDFEDSRRDWHLLEGPDKHP